MRITPGLTRSEITDKVIGQLSRSELRESPSRESRLEANTQRRTRDWTLDLRLSSSVSTADIDQHGDQTRVRITSDEIEQTVTQYEGRVWDWIAQRAFAFHEGGHRLYTDHDDKMSRLEKVEENSKGMVPVAQEIWNALEDAAIEEQIRNRWPNASSPILQLRANLFEKIPSVAPGNQGDHTVYPVAHAVVTGALDMGTYDSGRYRALIDPDDDAERFHSDHDREIFVEEIHPRLETVVETVLTTPDPVERNKAIFSFIEEIEPYIDSAQADGKAQMNAEAGGEISVGGMPNDAGQKKGGDPIDASALGAGSGDGDDDGDPAGGESEVPPIDSAVSREAEERIETEAREEAGVNDQIIDELAELSSVLGASPHLEDDELHFRTESSDFSRQRAERAEQIAQSLARILENRLMRQTKSRTERDRRRGRLDRTRTVPTLLGRKRVKMQQTRENEKDYHFAFVLDRSGSMSHDGKMESAEVALGAWALALEDNGVETMIVDLHKSKVTVSKPFGADSHRNYGRMFHGERGGGTPLSTALKLTRERLQTEGENNAIVVVTDGKPVDTPAYMDVLRETMIPVIGVQIRSGGTGAGDKFYHRSTNVRPSIEGLSQALMRLGQEVLL